MSLLSQAMSDCVFLNKSVVDDGYGGRITNWTEGAKFKAAIVFNSSIEARIAEKQGVTSLYTVTIHKDFMLDYNDVFRRVKDGKTFRVTSDGDDEFTPDSATLDMRQITAEEWEVPYG